MPIREIRGKNTLPDQINEIDEINQIDQTLPQAEPGFIAILERSVPPVRLSNTLPTAMKKNLPSPLAQPAPWNAFAVLFHQGLLLFAI